MKDISLIKEKGKIYELFAYQFAKEPTAEFLQLLQREENEAVFHSCGIDPFSDIRQLSFEQQAERLAIEYADLFLMPGVLTSPHESLQRGEGRLWGESTAEVNKIYQEFGFALDDNFMDTPDHLSVELSFLAELSKLEEKYSRDGSVEVKSGVLEVKKHFLKNHLLKWFSEFRDQLCKKAKLSYYREIVSFLGMVLDDEWENLKEVEVKGGDE